MILVLALVACTPSDTALPPPLPSEHVWSLAAARFVSDWQADETLPDLTSARCRRYAKGIRVYQLTERAFGHHTTLCPMTPTGCSVMGACQADNCATGTYVEAGGHVRVMLSPGEDSSGHVVTVRHELAHAFLACSTGSRDASHLRREVFGGAGIVWAQSNQ